MTCLVSLPKTRESAIQRTEKHILEVASGKVRLGWLPDELDQYIQAEYRRLRELCNANQT